jgi:hypothetical protein
MAHALREGWGPRPPALWRSTANRMNVAHRAEVSVSGGKKPVLEKFEKGETVMKKWGMIVMIGCLFVVPSLAQAQVDKLLDQIFERGESRIRPEDLRVLQLEISPDPVREGQRVVFRVTISNGSRHSERVTLAIRDKDEIISEGRDIPLRPGDNQVSFPESSYRFSRSDHCFTVEVDIQRTRSPIDTSREFCAKRTNLGWTLSDRGVVSDRGVGPLYVEELEIYPDPATPGQEIRFKIRLRNDGRPIRGLVRIQDRDQLVAQVENISIPQGYTEFQFPQSRYVFQRFDTCFTVLVDFERTPYPVDASRKFCARPMGWTLRP